MGLSIAVASVDASQCYDRIQHTIASLCLQAWGVPLLPIMTLLFTVQQMHFHLRTAHGDSDYSFTGAHRQNPFQGILQGNGAGPAVWLAISAFLVGMLHANGDTTTFLSPLSLTAICLAGLFCKRLTDPQCRAAGTLHGIGL